MAEGKIIEVHEEGGRDGGRTLACSRLRRASMRVRPEEARGPPM